MVIFQNYPIIQNKFKKIMFVMWFKSWQNVKMLNGQAIIKLDYLL